ncbi:MAG TPA: CPBP family intramembrane metalloprotease [Nitrospirae bacterium]|nr:CPBP family intramembrane metalloprotease [Nitrospirota bacterium]
MIIQKGINLRLSIKDALLGFATTFVVLTFFIAAIFIIRGRIDINLPSIEFVFITFIFIAIPEEAFFRGFILENIGTSIKEILICSLLFSIAHSHRFIILGDYFSFLTFFPSIIMGFLYVKTRNILPSVIFHALSNIAWFMIF